MDSIITTYEITERIVEVLGKPGQFVKRSDGHYAMADLRRSQDHVDRAVFVYRKDGKAYIGVTDATTYTEIMDSIIKPENGFIIGDENDMLYRINQAAKLLDREGVTS